jgi:hypothetical protein
MHAAVKIENRKYEYLSNFNLKPKLNSGILFWTQQAFSKCSAKFVFKNVAGHNNRPVRGTLLQKYL